MSRTDKDRPWQIIANDHAGKYTGAYWFHDDWHHQRRGGCSEACGWTLPHCRFRTPPADYRRAVWHGPERARERRQLRAVAREFNAGTGDPYEDFPNWQARSSAHWTWC